MDHGCLQVKGGENGGVTAHGFFRGNRMVPKLRCSHKFVNIENALDCVALFIFNLFLIFIFERD